MVQRNKIRYFAKSKNFMISKITDDFGNANADITAGYGIVEITITGKNLVPLQLEYLVENNDAGHSDFSQ